MKASIIIPTLNRAKMLYNTLESIVKQTTLSNVEIIVIDNGSTDDTQEVLNLYRRHIPNFRTEHDNTPGLLTGRHKGVEISTGEILCFIDDDVSLNPNYFEILIKTFSNNNNIHLATGPCLPNYEITPPDWLSYFWDETSLGKYCFWLSLLDFGKHEIEISPDFIWGLNFCIRKETLISLGGFHPDCIPEYLQHFQGDGETGLTSKAANNGLSAKYIPGLMLKHYVPKSRLTFEYFKKRAFYQGVCNSYTKLRGTSKPQEENKKENKEVKSIRKKLRDNLHPYYRWIKFLVPKKKKSLPKEIKTLIDSLAQIEIEGYNFHQAHFYNDRIVKDWVMRENYWNYKLPLHNHNFSKS